LKTGDLFLKANVSLLWELLEFWVRSNSIPQN